MAIRVPHLNATFVRCGWYGVLKDWNQLPHLLLWINCYAIAILVYLVEVQLAEERPTAPILLRLFGRKGIAAIAALWHGCNGFYYVLLGFKHVLFLQIQIVDLVRFCYVGLCGLCFFGTRSKSIQVNYALPARFSERFVFSVYVLSHWNQAALSTLRSSTRGCEASYWYLGFEGPTEVRNKHRQLHSGLHRQASRMGSKHIYFTGPNGILRCGLHVGGHDILDVCSNRVGVWVSFSESLGNVECESSRLSWTQLDRHGKNSSKTLYVGRCNGWRLFGHSMYVYVCKIWRCSVLGAWYDDLARLWDRTFNHLLHRGVSLEPSRDWRGVERSWSRQIDRWNGWHTAK